MAYIKKTGQSGQAYDETWGSVTLEGKLNVKVTEVGYTPMTFNLRKKALLFYPLNEPERHSQESLMVHFLETTFNF